MFRRWDTKITLGITGLHEISGRDYGIEFEEPYWGSSEDIVCMEEGLYKGMDEYPPIWPC